MCAHVSLRRNKAASLLLKTSLLAFLGADDYGRYFLAIENLPTTHPAASLGVVRSGAPDAMSEDSVGACSSDSESDEGVFVMLTAEGRVYGVDYEKIRFDFRSFQTFVPSIIPTPIDDLVQDCLIVDSPMCSESTFWLGCEDMAEPRCALEQLAAGIFKKHVGHLADDAFDKTTSGMEWWVQTLTQNSEKKIQMHWDKDETLREKSGVFVHPVVSTVTYLTASSDARMNAPTLIFDHLTVPLIARYGQSVPNALNTDPQCTKIHVSWPRPGKHVSFDGRLLHGVFPELGVSGYDDKNTRVTFLVNVWLNHKPESVHALPKPVCDALTKPSRPLKNLPKTTQPGICRIGTDAQGVYTTLAPLNEPKQKIKGERLADRFFGPSGDDFELTGVFPVQVLREKKNSTVQVEVSPDNVIRVVENEPWEDDERNAKRAKVEGT